jgi:hypothetical protein
MEKYDKMAAREAVGLGEKCLVPEYGGFCATFWLQVKTRSGLFVDCWVARGSRNPFPTVEASNRKFVAQEVYQSKSIQSRSLWCSIMIVALKGLRNANEADLVP